MQPLEDNNDGLPERLEIRQPGPIRLTVPDDRPAHPGPKTGAFAMDNNNPDTTIEVAVDAAIPELPVASRRRI